MRLGAYEIEGELGRGGMGVVYAARAQDGRRVAIKVLLDAHRDEARARFDRERRLLASLGEQAGFVPILDGGESAHGPWFVMPLVASNLRARLARGPLALDETRALGVALASALARAHAEGIVHRDLKPENVLLDEEGRPLVADLGLASDASAAESLTRSNALHGTAGYAAPEQLREARAATARADVFSLGAILHECLTGVPAFRGDNVVAILAKVEVGERAPARSFRPDVPPALEAAIERALDPDPSRRFADAGAFRDALSGGAPARGSRAKVVAAVFVLASAVFLALGSRGPRHRSPDVAVVDSRAKAPPKVEKKPRPSPLVENLEKLEVRAGAIPPPSGPPRRAEAERLARQAGEKFLAGEHDAALGLAERALALDATVARAWATRGEVHLARDELDAALADTSRALELDPTLAWVWTNRGIILAGKKELDRALADYDRALALDDRLAFAWMNRAALHVSRGERAKAIADYSRALELVPAPELFLRRSRLHEASGDRASAIADAERAIEVSPPGHPELAAARERLAALRRAR